MDKRKLKTPLLIISAVAGIVTGSCLLYYSQWYFIPIIIAAVICYLAAAGAIALLIMSRKGTKGKLYKKTAIATGTCNVVVVAAVVALVLNAFGIPIMPLRVRSMSWVGEFSYKEVMDSVDFSSPSFKTSGFVNTDEIEMQQDWHNVYDRAKLELEEKEDTYYVSYDKDHDVWMVRFGRIEKPTGYVTFFETVYLNSKGVTLLIAFEE